MAEIHDSALGTVERDGLFFHVIDDCHLLLSLVGECHLQLFRPFCIHIHQDLANTIVLLRKGNSMSPLANLNPFRIVRDLSTECIQFGRGFGRYVVLIIHFEDTHLARQGIRTSKLQGRYFSCILPVAHPTDYSTTSRCIAPAYRCIMVFSVVKPLGRNIA